METRTERYLSVTGKDDEFIGYYIVSEETATHFIAYKQGGGFQSTIPKEHCTEIELIPEALKDVLVTWEGAGIDFKAIVNANNLWNGWHMPYLERAEVEKMIANEKASKHFDESYSRFDFDGDNFIIHRKGEDEEEEVIQPSEIIYKGEVKQVYHFDNGWCWEISE